MRGSVSAERREQKRLQHGNIFAGSAVRTSHFPSRSLSLPKSNYFLNLNLIFQPSLNCCFRLKSLAVVVAVGEVNQPRQLALMEKGWKEIITCKLVSNYTIKGACKYFPAKFCQRLYTCTGLLVRMGRAPRSLKRRVLPPSVRMEIHL